MSDSLIYLSRKVRCGQTRVPSSAGRVARRYADEGTKGKSVETQGWDGCARIRRNEVCDNLEGIDREGNSSVPLWPGFLLSRPLATRNRSRDCCSLMLGSVPMCVQHACRNFGMVAQPIKFLPFLRHGCSAITRATNYDCLNFVPRLKFGKRLLQTVHCVSISIKVNEYCRRNIDKYLIYVWRFSEWLNKKEWVVHLAALNATSITENRHVTKHP